MYARVESEQFKGYYQRLDTDRYQMGEGYDYPESDILIFSYVENDQIFEIHLGKDDKGKTVINQVYLVA